MTQVVDGPARSEGPHLLSRLEAIAKPGGVLIATAYVFGFIIVAVHHAAFGILQFDLLKPRILAAGVIFMAFVAIAIYPAFWFFNAGWLARPNKGLSDDPRYSEAIKVLCACYFAQVAWVVALIMPFVGYNWTLIWSAARGATPPDVGPLGTGTGLLVLCSVVGACTRRWFARRPFGWTAANLLATIGLYAFTLARLRSMALLSVWFTAVGLTGVWLHDVSSHPRKWLLVRWEIVPLSWFPGVILFYALGIYSGIGAAYGGGAPVPVVLHLSADSPLAPNRQMDARLLDETEKGFYLVVTRAGRHSAVYVPRDLVSVIEFQPGRGKEGEGQGVQLPSKPLSSTSAPAPPPQR